MGIGSWQAPRPGVKVGGRGGRTILTVTDCVEMGIEAADDNADITSLMGAGHLPRS